MESSTAKRRKLSHGGAGPNSHRGGASTSATSAFVEATQELLDEVRVDYSQVFEGVDQTLHQFKETIENLGSHEPELIGTVTSQFEKDEKNGKIKIPYPKPRPAKDSQYKLAFSKPAAFNVVGSYQLKTMVKSQPEFGIDMIIVMPKSLFQEKDYRDLRYFYKRSYYLAKVAASLREKFKESFDFSFDHLHSNTLLPVLLARPKGKKSDAKGAYAIRVIPCVEDNTFPPSKLSLGNNNIKDATSPTPFYNSTLRAESLFKSYLQLLNEAAKTCAAYKDACVLGKIWLQQRGFNSTVSGGGFGHFEWAVLVALLLKSGGRKGEPVLSASLNASQLFKATIQYLAATSLQKKPVVIGTQADSDSIRQSGPVFYDAKREHNLFFKVSPWSANFLQRQAKWSLASLIDNSIDQFESLFIVKVDQVLQVFDVVFRTKIPSELSSSKSADHRGVAWDFSDRFYRVIKRALGDRSQLVHLALPKHSTWPVSANSSTINGNLLVGVVLDPSYATRKMDLGPSVEQKADAAKYREFWGDIAELRRFQDGSILESVQWDSESATSIPEQIIRYISRKHFLLQADDFSFGGTTFSALARISNSDAKDFTEARNAFDALEKEIRAIEDLPLHVRQVAPACPELRSASVHPPNRVRRLPMGLIISFEASSKWTDNIAANQRLKIAFLLKLGDSLTESNPEIKTHLGLEQVEHDSQNIAFLDVLYEDGFAFRLRLQSDVEEKILEARLRNKQLERHVHAEAEKSLAIYSRTYTCLPLHNQTVSTWCTRYPPLSDTMRILKHWFGCHKMASHFNEELLELFALKAFITPFPWQTPTSAMTGFLRTLQLLARWDWPEEPLIVDHSDSTSPFDRASILARYQEVRRSDPRMNRIVLVVATPHDASGTAFTWNGPSRVVANQMTKLARSACELVKTKGVDLDPRALFQSSLRHFDFVIRLNSKAVKSLLRDDGAKHSQFKNLHGGHSSPSFPLAQHPTKALVDQLKEVYSNALVFFHGGEDDNVIGVLFNIELSKRTRKVDMPCAYKPSKEEGSLEVDRQTIIAEIARVGADLIEKIEVKEIN
ncbi:putative U3 small nucleolar RNA-associated protein 22 [Seiridium cardinale]